MNQSISSENKGNHRLGRYSSASIDDNSHSISNGIALSLQAFVDDIPFVFNPKYRTIIVVSFHIERNDNSFGFRFSRILIFLSMIPLKFVIFFRNQ